MSAFKNLQKMEYSTDVMEVHNEFMIASDTMLKQAKEILAKETKINPAKIERLKSFGFKSSKDSTAIEYDKKEKSKNKDLIEAIEYFRVQFPNYKFIPQESVKAICEKYGLVSGEAHQYKGFVPEKNLADIEKFFESHPDMRHTYWRSHKSGDGLIAYISGDVKITKEEYDEILAKKAADSAVFDHDKLQKSIDKFMGGSRNDYPGALTKQSVQSFGKGLANQQISTQGIVKDYAAGIDPYDDIFMGYTWLKPRQYGRNEAYENMYKYMFQQYKHVKEKEVIATKKDVTLRICAPISEMNTQGYELRDGYRLVYDPIVSIEVNHKNGVKGEIIITAWGDEASDELIINQTMN